eukprot:Skav229175  [mRNA]  locus=scaffold1004:90519:91108:+ [translate_table: standard]
MFVIFVSHQLSYLHPETSYRLSVLRQALVNLINGSLSFDLREAYSQKRHQDATAAASWLQAQVTDAYLWMDFQKKETLVIHSPVQVAIRFGLEWQLDALGQAEFTVESERELEEFVEAND